MMFIIAGASLLGMYLDRINDSGKIYTIILSLLGVFSGMYLVIKEAIDMTKN